MYVAQFIMILETEFFCLIFLFLNLISLLSKYNRHDLFYFFPLIVLLSFYCTMQKFIHDSFFWYTKTLFLINFKLSN